MESGAGPGTVRPVALRRSLYEAFRKEGADADLRCYRLQHLTPQEDGLLVNPLHSAKLLKSERCIRRRRNTFAVWLNLKESSRDVDEDETARATVEALVPCPPRDSSQALARCLEDGVNGSAQLADVILRSKVAYSIQRNLLLWMSRLQKGPGKANTS